MPNIRPKPVQSLQRGLALLEAIASHPDGIILKALAAGIGCSSPATYHLVHTLVESGFVKRLESPVRYVLGSRCLHLAEAQRRDGVQRAACEQMRWLARELPGASLYFSEWTGGSIAIRAYTHAARPGHVYEDAGSILPPYASAGSFAHLAFWPQESVDAFERLYPFDLYGLPFWRSREAYEAALGEFRKGGTYFMREDSPLKLKLALPLFFPGGSLAAALTLQWNQQADPERHRPRLIAAALEAGAAFTRGLQKSNQP